MWKCSNCETENEDNIDVCCACGSESGEGSSTTRTDTAPIQTYDANLVLVEDYAKRNGLSSNQVIQQIREGIIAGKIYQQQWYVDLLLSNKIQMIDLSKDPFMFQKQTAAEIRDQLARELPRHAEVTVKGGKRPQIRIRDGLWRGMSLLIDNSSQQVRLTEISYEIPGFLSQVIIYIACVAVLSIIMTVVLSVAIGEFVPMAYVPGAYYQRFL